MLSIGDSANKEARLFEPGERLGWDWLDRSALIQPFSEPHPENPAVPREILEKFEREEDKQHRTIDNVRSLGVLGILVIIGLFVNSENRPFAILLLIVSVLFIIYRYRHRPAKEAYERALASCAAQGKFARAVWATRKEEFEREQQKRIAALPQWWGASTRPGTRKIQIFGGNLFSWEAFLTVFGTSMLVEQPPVMVIDLSEETVSAVLMRCARTAGMTVEEQLLPVDLATCHLLAGLDSQQLVDVLVEGMHHDTDNSDRAHRTVDAKILRTVSWALGLPVTIGRLAESMVALMGEPAMPKLLSSEEWHHIATDLFSATYLQQTYDRFRHIHAYLDPLVELGAQQRKQSRDWQLIGIGLQRGVSNAHAEVLTDLVVQWLMRAVVNGPFRPGVLVIAGADRIARRYLERLSDICLHDGIRLVYLFRYLRETSLNVIGGSATCVMRLGNHEEAARAADFIGREHTFKLHQFTRTEGRSKTHTEGESETVSSGRGGRSYSYSKFASVSTGSSSSDAVSVQRVYDYRVEPSVIQTLPDYAMLLVETGTDGPVFRPTYLDPEISTRGDTTTRALAQPYFGIPYERQSKEPHEQA